jgi:hypothetical protein
MPGSPTVLAQYWQAPPRRTATRSALACFRGGSWSVAAVARANRRGGWANSRKTASRLMQVFSLPPGQRKRYHVAARIAHSAGIELRMSAGTGPTNTSRDLLITSGFKRLGPTPKPIRLEPHRPSLCGASGGAGVGRSPGWRGAVPCSCPTATGRQPAIGAGR